MTIDELEKLSYSHPIIVYDGVCVLCNRFIRFVDKIDKTGEFRFATLQGEEGLALKKKLSISAKEETVILLHKGEYKMNSSVGLHIFFLLGYPYRLLYPLIYIPLFIRDWVYRKIAQNRYRLFGKTDSCLLPDKSMSEKLLS